MMFYSVKILIQNEILIRDSMSSVVFIGDCNASD